MSAVLESRVRVCGLQDLVPGSGVAALIDRTQIAIFYLPELEPAIYAIENFDPFSRANVLSRGLVGDVEGAPVVTSPVYKQHFDLATGRCLEDEAVAVRQFALHASDNEVWLMDAAG